MIIITVIICTAIYLLLRYIYSHWERKNIPFISPTIPFGNLASVILRKSSFGINIYELYCKTTEPFVGIYLLFRPAILVRDFDLIKKILSVDSASFHDRGIYCNPKNDPLSENLFALEGKRWKDMRAKLSPSFTATKIKNVMMPGIMVESDKLLKCINEVAESGTVAEMKDLAAKFTLNVISSVLFGLEIDTFTDPDNEFRKRSKEFNGNSPKSVINGVLSFLIPTILEFFKASAVPKDVETFFIDVVRQTIEYREKNNVSRKDFMQFLIQLRNDEKLTSADNQPISIETCAAQVFIFYVAGFESTSSSIAYTIHELARQPEKMRKLQTEIDSVLERHNNQLTYECIQEMHYLDLCLMETFRKYPFPLLNRVCTENYAIPNSTYTIEKGTPIIISLFGLLRDPKNFPEPIRYVPERFLEDNDYFNADAYNIPFGDGPRYCIGARLGRIVVQIGMIRLLSEFSFAAVDDKEIEFDNFSIPLVPKGGVNVKVSKRIKK